MSLPALTAITPRWEGEFAGMLGRSDDVHVVRRCADLAELLGSAAAGIAAVAAVSVELRGLDRSALATLRQQGLRVLGVFAPGDEAGRRTLLRWGVTASVSADATEEVVHAALAALVSEGSSSTATDGTADDEEADELARAADLDSEIEAYLTTADSTHATVEPARSPEAERAGSHALDLDPPVGEGAVLAVWGPGGGPGRSTVALNVASELSVAQSVLLIDGDTYGASLAQMLAMLDEAPGVVAAARAADNGTLDASVLSRVARQVLPGWQVLTGLPRADRWPELREHAMADVLSVARQVAAWTVMDLGFCVEQDEEVSFDTVAPRRNGVALRALDSADHVLLVGSADPIGLQRLVRSHQELREHTQATCTVVVTRVRASAVGRHPTAQIREVLTRMKGLEGIHLVPEDVEAMDAALLAGVSLREIRPGSAARRALVEVADSLSPGQLLAGRPRRRDGWRGGRKSSGLP